MSGEIQDFDHHAKMVPMYHYGAFGLVVVPLFYFAAITITGFSLERLMMTALAMGVILTGFFARIFPLGVQDRVIRIEERARLEGLLPEDLKGRIGEITTTQLVGLRFASDEEVAELTRRVLNGEFADRKSIKQAIQNWRADHQRI